MDLYLTEDHSKQIVTDTDYSPEYRFRLWVALVDDLDLLGMGYRAYHSHIMRGFQEWHKAGFKFLHPRGHELNLSELTPDDLYGFLGKLSNHPNGPARNIKVHKFAVLDAFFKTKYPERAAAFKEAQIIESLAYVGRMFFGGSDKRETSRDGSYALADSINAVQGIYFKESIELNKIGNSSYFSVLLIRPAPHGKYAYVWKILFPIEEFCIAQDPLLDPDNLPPIDDGYNTSPIVSYEGVGFIALSSLTNTHYGMACILRDRRTYFPATTFLSYATSISHPRSERALSLLEANSKSMNNSDKYSFLPPNSEMYSVYVKINKKNILINDNFIFYIIDFCGNLYNGDSK